MQVRHHAFGQFRGQLHRFLVTRHDACHQAFDQSEYDDIGAGQDRVIGGSEEYVLGKGA
ncbi:hypothetical protein D3C85_1819660 [compost metagenome]